MSSSYKFRDQDHLHFITYTIVEWIDLFTRNIYKDVLLDSWRYCIEHKGMDLYAWVIMSNHVHMIIGSHQEKLSKIMADMKRHTSIKLKEAIKSNPGESRKRWMVNLMKEAGEDNCNNVSWQLWQQDNHPIELYTNKVANQKLNYIHFNPVKAGIVRHPSDYIYSSAGDYEGIKGPIDIQVLPTFSR